jgi:hypothetical protein
MPAPQIRRIARADRIRMPWANGLGVTEEIARSGPDGRPSWRLSVAELRNSGPFSPLAGIDRVFTVIGDSGVRLDLGGAARDIEPLTPCAFPGEEAPGCTLTAPTEAFNVMVERGSVRATVTPVDAVGTAAISGSADALLAVFVVRGSGALDEAPAEPGDCLLLDPAPRLFRGTARLLVVELGPAACGHHAGISRNDAPYTTSASRKITTV